MLLGGSAAAADKAAVCQATKLRAAGKRAVQELKCHAAATAKGKDVDAACATQAGAKLAKAFTQAEKKAACPGGAGDVDSVAGAFVRAVTTEVATGSNALSLDIAVNGEGTLEVEFTTPVADPSFSIDDLLVNLLRWNTGATSTLRVETFHGNENGTVTVDMAGPEVKGRLVQSPSGAVDFYLEGTHYSVSPGQSFTFHP